MGSEKGGIESEKPEHEGAGGLQSFSALGPTEEGLSFVSAGRKEAPDTTGDTIF